MDSLIRQYSRSPFANEGYTTEEEHDYAYAVPQLSLKFALPPVPRPSAFLRATTDDYANPNCPIKIAHGTTTLAFRFKGGIIVATDSRATAGNWIASQTVKKVIEINPMLLGTMAGGAAVRACARPLIMLRLTNDHRTVNTGWLISVSNVDYTNSVTSAESQ